MIKVVYHSNPNQPKDSNHWGRFAKLTDQDHREFNDEEEAIAFWLECDYPITQLIEIPTKKLDKSILMSVQQVYDEDAIANTQIEEYLTSQKELYSMLDEDSIL
jgi:hypothetical protein